MDRFTSNQDKNDHRPILHAVAHVVEYISPAKMLLYPGGTSQRLPGCVPVLDESALAYALKEKIDLV